MNSRKSTPLPHAHVSAFDSDFIEERTPLSCPCLACEGQLLIFAENVSGQYKSVPCTWCSYGVMTSEQIRAYLEHKHLNL